MTKFMSNESRLRWLVGFMRWQFDIDFDEWLPLVQIERGGLTEKYVFQYKDTVVWMSTNDLIERNSWMLAMGETTPYEHIFKIGDLDSFVDETAKKMISQVVAWDRWVKRPIDWSTYFESRNALEYFLQGSCKDSDFKIYIVAHEVMDHGAVDTVKIGVDVSNGVPFDAYDVEVIYEEFARVSVRLLQTVSLTLRHKDAHKASIPKLIEDVNL